MNKMSKELEYYRIGQNKSDENIIQMWIQHCLNLDEINYIFVGALRKDRLELCSRLYNIGSFDNFTPSIFHAEYAVSKEARDFLKRHLYVLRRINAKNKDLPLNIKTLIKNFHEECRELRQYYVPSQILIQIDHCLGDMQVIDVDVSDKCGLLDFDYLSERFLLG